MAEMKKALKKVKPYVPGKPVEEVRRELGLDTIYKLASNEIPFSPDYIRKAVLKEIEQISRYPEASCFYLRKTLAKKMKVAEDQLVFGNGSDEIIVMALRAFLEKGDEIVVGFPTFLIYEIQAMIEEAGIIRVPFKDNRLDLKAMAAAVSKKTKLIFVTNPDNPHGTYVTDKEVESFLKKIPRKVLVFFDEAYYEFVTARDFPNTLKLIKKRGNIIITRTFSKAYGLAGLRIGYGITTPEIARILDTVREPFNVNRFSQVCAASALEQKAFLKKVTDMVKKGKAYIYQELDKLGLEYAESQTNFILIDFKQDTAELNKYLLSQGVIVRMMTGWGLKRYFRVTVGLQKENRAFIKALKAFMKKTGYSV